MKTAKLTSAIATFSLVLFMSIASIANSNSSNTGDINKSGDKSPDISGTSEMEYSYLRFDLNKYINENETIEFGNNSFDYLRFNVINFSNETEAIEMPVANEFEYLRFDVNSFIENNSAEMNELPVNEYNYLHFDVSNYTTSASGSIDEMPEKE